jgi:hypothetical protein
MRADRYEAPPSQLRTPRRPFGLTIACLIDHATAIASYERRMAAEADPEVRDIMASAQTLEFRHFGHDLELLLRADPEWRTEIESLLGQPPPLPLAGDGDAA